MGRYTELIFGAVLEKDTPDIVINTLKYMLGEIKDKPNNSLLSKERCELLFKGSSDYFGIDKPVNRLWFNDTDNQWRISTRSNIKNYKGEIEEFLNWIKPYIESGSGVRDMYAIVISEEATEPTIYYLDDE